MVYPYEKSLELTSVFFFVSVTRFPMFSDYVIRKWQKQHICISTSWILSVTKAQEMVQESPSCSSDMDPSGSHVASKRSIEEDMLLSV